jgi:hypothetical protein
MECPSGEQLRYFMVENKVDLYTTWYGKTCRPSSQIDKLNSSLSVTTKP